MSANAISAEGVLVNIDGTGNRLAALCFGPKQVLVLCSAGKIQPTTETAVSRARNTAAPGQCPAVRRKDPLCRGWALPQLPEPGLLCNQILLTPGLPSCRTHPCLSHR